MTKIVGFRLTDTDAALLDAAQAREGLMTRTEALRFVLRAWARAEGVKLPAPKPRARRRTAKGGR